MREKKANKEISVLLFRMKERNKTKNTVGLISMGLPHFWLVGGGGGGGGGGGRGGF